MSKDAQKAFLFLAGDHKNVLFTGTARTWRNFTANHFESVSFEQSTQASLGERMQIAGVAFFAEGVHHVADVEW